jgi:hypothetical protein
MKYKSILFVIIFIQLAVSYNAQTRTMPVELVSFTYELIGGKVLLYWQTATETNNAEFDVQRSIDTTWDTIAWIQGAGTSSSPKCYSYTDPTVVAGNEYFYRLKQIDNDGDYEYSDTLTVSILSGVEPREDKLLTHVFLEQNYPNPFNPSTVISYKLSTAASVILKIFDVTGKEIATIINEFQIAGNYLYSFSSDTYSMASGIYFYSLIVDNIPLTKSMIIIK